MGSSPNWTYGQVPTAEQWNLAFSQKQDDLGYTPVNRAGDVMSGPLGLTGSTALKSGLNLPPGTAPTSPVSGDVWTTSDGLYVRVGGTTVGPLTAASGTLSSVALALPAEFDVSGSPLTEDGTITAAWDAQAANLVFAGPASGADAVPTFRALVAADLGDGVTGTGAVVLADSPALTTPDLGTPSAVTLTNGTGLPIATGVSGLGTSIATFLGTPSSANLAAALTDETGTGAAVFAGSPALTGTPTAPTAASGTNTTQLATTAFAAGTLSDGTSGYLKFPGGEILQWGFTSGAGAKTFPVTFPNHCRSVIATMVYGGTVVESCAPQSVTTTGFSANPVYFNGTTIAAAADSYYWQAIGN